MSKPPTNLCIVWTSPQREVALHMAFMYGGNAAGRGWWEQVRFIVWGPSQPLLLGDGELKSRLAGMAEAGVELMACKACAENYDIVKDLADLDLNVQYTGTLLTQMLKAPDWSVLTV
ncbi:MAG: DsrE family protein [Proteobacteria bacterium]|nr:DsrE family protein [Pseudomonadota bacterium]